MIKIKEEKRKTEEIEETSEESKLNSLPDYTIRTMKDDLTELSLGKMEKEATTQRTEQEKMNIFETAYSKKNEEKPKEEIQEKAEEILQEPGEPRKTFVPKKSPLPDTEELIAPTPPQKEQKTESLTQKEEPAILMPPENLPISEKTENKEASKPKFNFVSESELMGEEGVPAPPKAKTRTKKSSKRLLVLIIILILVLVAGGVFYWFSQKPTTIENEPEPTPEETIKISEALIYIDQTKQISISEENIFELLEQETQKQQNQETVKRIVLIKQNQEISLKQFFEKIEANIPPYLSAELDETHTLVTYSNNEENRLGIIVKAKNIDNLREQLAFWEETMVEDLKQLFLGRYGNQATSTFQDNTYKGVSIRYMNFPDPELTIDYAIINDLFVLTTSKESMYKIIDRIKTE